MAPPDQIANRLDAAQLHRCWIVDNGMHPTDNEGVKTSETLLAVVDAIYSKEGPT